MDNQFKIFSINFGAFYSEKEKRINKNKIDICNQMHDIESYYKFIIKNKISEEDLSCGEYLKLRREKGALNKYYENAKEENIKWENKLREMTENERKKERKFKAIKEDKEAKAKARDNEIYQKLKILRVNANNKLKQKLKNFNGIRRLRQDSLKNENLISLFDNSCARTMNIECDTTSMDIICVTISHYDVMEQLIDKGFEYLDVNNKLHKYRVFTSSAGQIRKKKTLFIDEEVWNKYNYSIMCGLSWDRINSLGGMNINKFLSYLALQNSATERIEGFNIDQCIVIDDFRTTLVDRDVDFIEKISKEELNKDTKEMENNLYIKDAIKIKKNIEIEHSDGCGIQLIKKKSFQIRLPFVKGLMTYGNYKKFCEETKNANPIIEDLWGKKWNVIEDDIKYIFTKSQFKMWKYYENVTDGSGKIIMTGWDVYKACFKCYNCHASYCNEEENIKDFRSGQFNYQYWQSLTDVKDEEIDYFTKPIIDLINNCHKNVKDMLQVFGIHDNNKNMNIEQRILKKYPVLLKDFHFQDSLSSKLSKIKKEAKSGKFKTKSINTFLLPDIYAWFEQLFLGIEVPEGLLKDGEVSCKYFKDDKLLLDRSPHLYREHAVRNNITKENCKDERKELMSNYFVTNGIYTSTHDLISKILQFDVDGDHALVTSDKILIDIAERNCKDILPLYYDMGKADAELITEQNIINSLKSAFKYGNIGIYSNKITNVWNSDNFDENAMNLIKLLTSESNYSIDSAKTLEMVDLDDEEKNIYKDLLKQANGQMPYFFQFAKDKDKNSVKKRNNSTVNRICANIEENVIDNYKYDFSKLGKFNVRYLVSGKWNDIDIKNDISKSIIEKFKEIDNTKNKLFMKAKKNKQEIDSVAPSIYSIAKEEFDNFIKDLNITYNEVSNILIKYYFSDEKTSKKTLLINLFGENILNNLEESLKDKDFGFCEVCGERFDKNKTKSMKQKYCNKCAKEVKKENDKIRIRELRKSM